MKTNKYIVNSLADTDKYKFTMGYVFFVSFSNISSKYKFKNRSDIDLLPFKDEITRELKHLCELRFTPEELIGIKLRNPYFSNAYMEFLRNLQLNFDFLDIGEKDGKLSIETKADVPLIYATWFEIHVLQIVQEVYTRNTYPNMDYSEGDRILDIKIEQVNELYKNVKCFTFADFITRRRFNFERQEHVLTRLKNEVVPGCFGGTSNMYFAMKLDIKDVGTMAHEYLQVGEGLDDVSLRNFQKHMLQKWMDVYQGRLGIALTDVVGFDAFLNDFGLYFARFFDGCRHDSGDPFIWGEKLIHHYESLEISPTDKTAVFSDGVTFDLMFRLIERFKHRIKLSFGIGTNLVNDFGEFFKTLQMVMKLIECNGNPVAKISDSPGKGMCESDRHMRNVRETFHLD